MTGAVSCYGFSTSRRGWLRPLLLALLAVLGFFVVIFVTALVGAGISAKGWLYQRVDGLIDLTTINRRRPADYSSRRGSE